MSQELHIVSHTHWDREWYMSFSSHRYRLVKLMDELIETAERDEEFKSFHLDGQLIVIEDYLEVRPEMRDRLVALIAKGKIKIGPFYILQDEYLIDGESNIRNIIVGIDECRAYGDYINIGYFPDAFGNISQIPQILKGFGMDCAYFGRGIIPMGYANEVLGRSDEGFSEIIWEGADGSRVIGIQFTNWYHNAMEIPSDPDLARDRLRQVIANAALPAKTPYLLGMNGCDHTPVQTDIGQIISKVKEVDSVKLVHSDLYTYYQKIKDYSDSFYVYKGEICGQNGNGYGNLIDTASSRIYLKQYQHRALNLIESKLEPISIIAMKLGKDYDKSLIRFLWKRLLANMPHDSICGCSCDDVHEEMVTRYKAVIDTADYKVRDLVDYVLSAWNITSDRSVCVINCDVRPHSGTVRAIVDLPEGEKLSDKATLYSEDGTEINCTFRYLGCTQKVELPDNAFRRLYNVERYEVELRCDDLKPMSLTQYRIADRTRAIETPLVAEDMRCENAHFVLTFNTDGSFDLLDKATGRTYSKNNYYSDTDDLGDEYTYMQGETYADTLGDTARIELIESNSLYALYEVTNSIRGMTLTTYLRVDAYDKLVKVKLVYENTLRDHRLRAMFDPRIDTDTVHAEVGCDCVERRINPGERYTNPSNTQRMNKFVYMSDSSGGLLVATRGLHEYEVMRDGTNTLALTVTRAIGRLGDWITLPTEGAQVQGNISVEYAVGIMDAEGEMFKEAYLYTKDKLITGYVAKAHGGADGIDLEPIDVSADVETSAIKLSEDGDGVIVRLYNISDGDRELKLNGSVTKCMMNESEVGAFDGTVRKKEILTLRLR